MRIAWYLERYHAIKISSGGVYHVLKRHGMSRLPRNAKKRTLIIHRYEKQEPGHHIQFDVKYIKYEAPGGK